MELNHAVEIVFILLGLLILQVVINPQDRNGTKRE